jgi:hypothetical protein
MDSRSCKRLFKTTICLPSTSCRSNTNGDNIISHSSPLTIQATFILATARNVEYEESYNEQYDRTYSDDCERTHVPEGMQSAQKAYVKTKPWAPFFEVRAKQNEAQLESETAQQCEARLNRERNPPTVSAEVYEWDWSEEDPLVLVRTRIPKKSREDTLQGYESSQCR